MTFNPNRRTLLKASLAAPMILRAGMSRAATTDIKFSNAAPFDGSNAAYFLGEQKGWYKEAGLNCTFDAAGGSGEAVSRVGSGVYDLGVADINNVMEFNLKNPGSAIKGVYMLYYRSPLCAISMAKAGISKPADLTGKKIGAAAADGAYRLFPAFTKAANLDVSTITWNMVGLQLREATLVRNEADAILGFDSTLYFGLKKAGVNVDDLRFLYYSDVGLDLYGNCLVVSQKMRALQPGGCEEIRRGERPRLAGRRRRSEGRDRRLEGAGAAGQRRPRGREAALAPQEPAHDG